MNSPIRITDQTWSNSTIPVVSVFNWVYNHKDFIRQSIKSILMQETTFPVEIIIQDDASNDGTREIIEEYQNKYPHLFNNILFSDNQYSQGKSIMNGLFEKPRGKYIALAHGDDYWTDPLKLQKQVDIIENSVEVGLVYSNFSYLEGSKISEHEFEYVDFIGLADFFNANIPFLFTGSWLINKKYMEQFQLIYKYLNLPVDAQLACEILLKGGKIVHLNEQTGVYRVLAESASHSRRADKDIGFLQLKYTLMKKYRKEISSKTIKVFLASLVRKQFHNFSYLELNFPERSELLPIMFKLKGFKRSFKYLVFNKA
jgi:glycosyltransferase involved in cell wall biosynthesis